MTRLRDKMPTKEEVMAFAADMMDCWRVRPVPDLMNGGHICLRCGKPWEERHNCFMGERGMKIVKTGTQEHEGEPC